ncbi:MAG: hypothetical protein KatS3mg003_1726 [Candidatus Nitrosocaldaceae archaeon]|nr:MAG: cell division protein SepF [Candidatus Nitrosothermus koennekii]GIU72247.1 MAG: hypothetical protein KatS3mg003_1726 [Candidatus Nitrosocaldaceae archaeon]
MQKTKEITTFVKAVTLRDLKDLTSIKNDIEEGMILIIRITPLAQKSIEELREAIDKLYDFVKSIEGDIARLGEERVVITPPNVKIWKDSNKLQ